MSGQLPRFHRYRVRRGDSLWRIAERAYGHGDAWMAIRDANRLKPGRPLFAGEDLFLPMLQHAPASLARGHQHPSVPRHGPTQTHSLTASHDQSPSHPANATHQQSLLRTGPFQPARPVLFPAFKHEMKQVVAQYETLDSEIILTYTGEMNVQKEGVITGGLTFSKEGIEAEYKKESEGIFHDFFQKCTASYDGEKAEVKLAVGSTLRQGNQVLATTEVAYAPPSGVKYTYKGQEIKFSYRGFEFAGVLGYELEAQKRTRGGTPELQPQVAPATNWKRVAGIGLGVTVIVVGVGIIVADVAKDVGTGGAGLVESPLSFAAAARLFATGGSLIAAGAR